MQPNVSIIVPVYNAEKTLERCVDSILNQTYGDFELLLVNDGSQDASGAICDHYAARDSRIRVFHRENAGVSAARNLALAMPLAATCNFWTAMTGSPRMPPPLWCGRRRNTTAIW